MPKTILRHKVYLVLLGFVTSLVLLEISLRIGGFLFLFAQKHQNEVALREGGDTRILCLGESMTALGGDQAYPLQLERILNASQSKTKFTVINKGIPSITTSHIIANLEKYLDAYQPSIVITMMGINDGTNFKSAYDDDTKPWIHFLHNFQTYKFFKLLKAHLSHIRTDIEIRNIQKRLVKLKQFIDSSPSSENYTKLAGLYRALLKWNDEEKALVKALELNPHNFEALGYLGIHFRRKGEYDKAIVYFRQAVDYSPENGDYKLIAYNLLAEAYTLLGQYKEAEQTHLEAMKNVPKYLNGYYFIGDIYLHQNKYGEAITLFRKQLEVNPAYTLTYGKMAYCLRKQGFYDTAERLLKEGIKLNPNGVVIYSELASHLIEQNKFAEAEQVIKKALELKKDLFAGIDINLLDYLLASYVGQGKRKEANALKAMINANKNNYNFETFVNYQKLQEILAKRGIVLVAVQYPMRDITSLKTMLSSSHDTIIVDNQGTFQKVVEEKGYDYLFNDRFAGDFGHCTPEGNRLMAENIAKTILTHF